jgi:hypothetical protein
MPETTRLSGRIARFDVAFVERSNTTTSVSNVTETATAQNASFVK